MDFKILIAFLFTSFCFSQVSISGSTTTFDGKPIGNVSVFNTTNNSKTTTDEVGNFVLNVKSEGTYTVIFYKEGFALQELNIYHAFVSREKKENTIDYSMLNVTTFDNFQIIINCTPLGTITDVTSFPPITYEFFTEKHIAFDLVYNPAETQFLKKAKKKGATIKNGYDMLVFQAEKSWRIWNK